ncbi:MAG: hypothetical protein R2911_06105 [Caldilineaceae bacterium]
MFLICGRRSFWFLIVVIVSALASLLPARNAANLSVPGQTLAYE